MTAIISKAFGKCFPATKAMLSNFHTLSRRFGQWRSIREGSAVAANGSAIPWYTYPAIEYLGSFDLTSRTVFEFGSGNSSRFWAMKTQSVISVEDDEAWFHLVEQTKLANQTILHRPDMKGYVSALAEQNRKFDVIIIDGKWREKCVEAAPEYLTEAGMIILDNSDRHDEQKCGQALRKRGFFQIDFSGFGPINSYCWTTSVFIKAPTSLQEGFAGPRPISGLDN